MGKTSYTIESKVLAKLLNAMSAPVVNASAAFGIAVSANTNLAPTVGRLAKPSHE